MTETKTTDRATAEAPPKPMNILLIMVDQMRRDHMGHTGDPVVRTPNLDGLAAKGTDFSRHYTCAPTCAPNRASLFTARMPSAHGLRVNGMSLEWDFPTVTQAIADAGFTTHLVGKSHLQPYGIGMGEKEVMKGTGEFFPDEGPHREDYTYENAARHRRERVEFPESYYGWQNVDLTLLHGDAVQGHYYWWLKDHGVAWEDVVGPTNALERSAHWPDVVYQPAVPQELYPTKFVEEKTVEALRTHAPEDKPFFLVSSFPDPHHPFTPPGDYWGRYNPDDLALPETFDDPLEEAPPHIRAMKAVQGQQKDVYLGFSPSPEQYQDAMAAEYGQIEMLDDSIGVILTELEALGIADNTAIVFAGDHGDMLGDHGLMLKHCMHYDAMLRVPLTVYVPGQSKGVNDNFVMTMDIGATLLDLAGVAPIQGQQGRSVLGGVTDPADAVRNAAYVEEELSFGTDGLDGPIRMRTVVTEEGRMTLYSGEEFGELFDLKADPQETNNLWAKPEGAALKARLMETLAREAIATDNAADVPRYVG